MSQTFSLHGARGQPITFLTILAIFLFLTGGSFVAIMASHYLDRLTGRDPKPNTSTALQLALGGSFVVTLVITLIFSADPRTRPAWVWRLSFVLRRWFSWLFFSKAKCTLRQEFRLFFGPDYDLLETHDKDYPGYDLASIHRALASFREDCCEEFKEIGGVGDYLVTMRQLFDRLKQPGASSAKATASTFQRLPIGVDEEESFATNALYFCVMKPAAGRRPHAKADLSNQEPHAPEAPAAADPERIGIYLATFSAHNADWDGIDAGQTPRQLITLSIACRSKEVADRFFAEIEERRKRLSIYRGKVIDPVVHGGVIHSIGFRAIQKVKEADLILSDNVKALLQSSILSFYQHRELMEGLGIELKRGILFHSPPGTGKTSISLYLAGRLPNFTVCFISGERLLYPREICRMARYLQPSMVVFEDIDLVAQDRNATGLGTVLGELMNQIDGCEPNEQVLFIMNTNSLERLEHAVRNRPGRVDQIIQIPLPDTEERSRLLGHFSRNFAVSSVGLDRVLDATEGATPAMLKEIAKRAAVHAIQRLNAKSNEPRIEVAAEDLLLATQQVREMREPELVPGTLGFRKKARESAEL